MPYRGRRSDPYAGAPGRRVFLALPIPGAAAAEISAVVEAVRAQPLPDGARDVRWVRLDGLHLTLRFLGPTPEPTIEQLSALVPTIAEGVAPIQATFAGAGSFPTRGRPRTLWIGVRDGIAPLEALAARVGEALTTAGWPPDGRELRPHLTLARSDGIAVGSLVAGRLVDAMADRVIQCALDRLVLYESQTGGGPARYVPIAASTLVRGR